MSLLIEDESIYKLPFDIKSIALTVIDGVLDYERCPYETETNLILTSCEEIAKINEQFRGVDSATDVLSFPNVDFRTPSDFASLEDNILGNFDPESGKLILGDIMIATEKVAEQAAKFEHSLTREFAFLIAHSVLHLLGYDHMVPEEEVRMQAKQKEILEILKISR